MVWGCGVISLALPIVPTTKLPTKWCYATQLPTNRYPHSGKSWLIWLIKLHQQVKENPLN